MDTFVDSSWYFFRFCDPQNTSCRSIRRRSRTGAGRLLQRRRRARHPAPDLLALLLPRSSATRLTHLDEPFTRLLTQGMVLKDGQVMSKSKGNVVDPDDMIRSTAPTRCGST
jgi:leucyl-tRNA synthetase